MRKKGFLITGICTVIVTVTTISFAMIDRAKYVKMQQAEPVNKQEAPKSPRKVKVNYELIDYGPMPDYKKSETKEDIAEEAVYEMAGETVQEYSFEPLNIFVGDSRTVGLKSFAKEDDIYIAEVGKGYKWYNSTAKSKLLSAITNNPGKYINVYFNLGVNDLENIGKYIKELNTLAEVYPECSFHYISLNPVEDTLVTNTDIELFNAKLMSELSEDIKYIDTYSYLQSTGYKTTDGLHYTNDTYDKIYKFITG